MRQRLSCKISLANLASAALSDVFARAEHRNMDARAGGISEADDAGADLDSIRSHAGHTQASTTARYIRGTIGKSRKVAELRLAHRKASRKHDVNEQ
jgi:hypothetical protein